MTTETAYIKHCANTLLWIWLQFLTVLFFCHSVFLAKLSFLFCFLPVYPVILSHFTSFSFHPYHPLFSALCAHGRQGNSSNLSTHVPLGQGAIRGLSTSLSSCYKWWWQDGEGSHLYFEGQQGHSPPLCQWLLGPHDQQRKIQLWIRGPIQPHTYPLLQVLSLSAYLGCNIEFPLHFYPIHW